MRKALFPLFIFLFVQTTSLMATPTGLFWTPCYTNIQDTGHVNLNVNNYFTLFKSGGHRQALPTDVGLEFGIFSIGNLKAEAGVDYLVGSASPLYFNGKVGMEENKLFCHAPSFSIGGYGWGTRTHGSGRTNQNIVNLNVGKSLPEWIGGILYAGVYSGSKAIGKDRQGFMLGLERPFCKATDRHGAEYHKWSFMADYCSGKNTQGGGGVGLIYYFAPDISLETGPTWFTTRKYNGRWKWSVQLNVGL